MERLNFLKESDQALIHKMAEDDQAAFEMIFHRYWEKLFSYLYNRLHNKIASEEIVQEVLISIWEKRKTLSIHTSLSSYLYKAAKYRMLNYIRSEKVRKTYFSDFLETQISLVSDPLGPQLQNVSDLKDLIEKRLQELPPKCREVYRMSREEHIPNQEIADQLRISKKTVENYLTIALKHLRIHLADYIMILVVLIGMLLLSGTAFFIFSLCIINILI